MAPKYKLFQASFSAALAIALFMSVSLARAEVVTLVCKNESGSVGTDDSFTLRVDYDRKIVDLLRSDGTAHYSAPAKITEGSVEWGSYETGVFRGSLDRLSGKGSVAWPSADPFARMSGSCRRATQKF